MNQDPDSILLRVLTAIDYQGNKFKFVKKFKKLCHFQACWDMVEKLSHEDKERIKKEVSRRVTPGGLKRILKKWYADDDYTKALYKATQEVFDDTFGDALSKMSDIEKQGLGLDVA
ncbi:hypothetical protein ACFL1M_03570 [Patescibacteria group bacterium]